MFENYTDRVRRVTLLAQEEARRLRHSSIGSGHLLLGLLREGEGLAVEALAALGLQPNMLRDAVEARMNPGNSASTAHLPFTEEGKLALQLSEMQATELGHSYVGTEHLLLGLLSVNHGVAASVLQTHDVYLERAREQVVLLLANRIDSATAVRRQPPPPRIPPLAVTGPVSEAATACLRAVNARSAGEPIQTADLLMTIMDLDRHPWTPLTLQIGDTSRLRQQRQLDPSGEQELVFGINMTPASAHAFRYAMTLAEDYGLETVTTGLLSLALASDPASGAVRTVRAGSTVDYERLLALIEEHILEVELEPARFYPPWLAERLPDDGPGNGDIDDLDALTVRSKTFSRHDAPPLALHLLAAVALHSRGWLRDTLNSLSLDHPALRDSRVIGADSVEDEDGASVLERADSLAGRSGARGADVAVAALIRPSPAVARWCSLVNVAPDEATAQLRFAALAEADTSTRASLRTMGAMTIGMVLSFLVAALAVVNIVGSGGWWKLPLIYLAFHGYPSSSLRSDVVVAAIFAWLFSPLVGAVVLLHAAVTLVWATSERNESVEALGVRLSLERFRRVLQRRHKRSRRFRQWRQERHLASQVSCAK